MGVGTSGLTICLLVTSLTLCGCTPDQSGQKTVDELALDPPDHQLRDFVANGSIRLPSTWSYDFSRQGAESWQFSFSPRPMSLDNPCHPRTGALSEEPRARAEVFVTGYALPVGVFPGATGRFAQIPGEFVLDERSLAGYETLGCHPTYRMDFELDDYSFIVHVAVSEKAQKSTVQNVLEVLNSIR